MRRDPREAEDRAEQQVGDRLDSFQLPRKHRESLLQLEPAAPSIHPQASSQKKCLRRPPNPDHATLSLGSPVPLWVPTLSPAEDPGLQRNSPEIRCSAPPRHLGCRRADTSPSASPWSCLLRVHKVPATALAPTPSLRPRAFLL